MRTATPRRYALPTRRWRPSTSRPIRGILSGITRSAQGYQDDAVIVERSLTRTAKGEAQIRFHEPYDPAKLEGKQLFIGHDSRGDLVVRGSEGAPFWIEVHNEP